jgi:hypothetical protein
MKGPTLIKKKVYYQTDQLVIVDSGLKFEAIQYHIIA